MKRILLKMFGNPFEAHMAADRLTAAGYPAFAGNLLNPLAYYFCSWDVELWLEDSRVLANLDTRLEIEQILEDHIPLDEDDSYEIERMPLVDR